MGCLVQERDNTLFWGDLTPLLTNDPLKKEGPAMAPLLLFLEQPEAGTGAGQKEPEALCVESRHN